MSASPHFSVSEQRRQRVHDAVRALLAEQGFRISMEAVALRAGCSKQTLYAQFGNKQGLIRSVISEHMDLATAHLAERYDDPRTTLVAFAIQHVEHLCDTAVLATSQLISAEVRQFPEEAQALYRDACDTLVERLAVWLKTAMKRGQLRHDEPHYAAELLLSMIVGMDFERQRFGMPHRDTDTMRKHWAEFAVDAFLRAFSPAAIAPMDPVARPAVRLRSTKTKTTKT